MVNRQGMTSSARCRATARCGVTILALFLAAPAGAQSLNDLTGSVGKSAGGLLGGGLPSVDQASIGNLAGVLEFCIKNKYLGGGDAKSVQQSLLGKVGGSGEASEDIGFKAGSGGILETGGGETFGLGGSGIEGEVTEKVCDLVLQHGQSLL